MIRARRRRQLMTAAGVGTVTAIIFIGCFTYLTRSKPASIPVAAEAAVIAKTMPPTPSSVHSASFRGLPVGLKIPAINVNSQFEFLGLTKSGDMVAPSDPAKAGWYKYGALPGETGSAVLAGHVVDEKGRPGVFANLKKLQKGNLLQVIDSHNNTATFIVSGVRTYDQKATHDDVFSGVAGTHLNIITCAGDWDSAQHHYTERLVVFSDLAPTLP